MAEVDDKRADAAATALAAGVAILAAGLGAFGAFNGTAARMARNHPNLTVSAVALVLAAVVCALASRIVRNVGGSYVWLWVSLGFFIVGLTLAFTTLTSAISDDDRPSIASTTSRDSAGTTTIAATAKAGGLAADENVRIRAFAYTASDKPGGQIYYAVVGPDPDGSISHAFAVLVDPDIRYVVLTVNQADASGACRLPSSSSEKGSAATPSATPSTITKSRSGGRLWACALVSIAAPSPTATASTSPSPGAN